MSGWKWYVLEVLAILFTGAAICASSYFVFGVSRAGVKDIAMMFVFLTIFYPPLDLFLTRLKKRSKI